MSLHELLAAFASAQAASGLLAMTFFLQQPLVGRRNTRICTVESFLRDFIFDYFCFIIFFQQKLFFLPRSRGQKL
jgi:hypothetical protein